VTIETRRTKTQNLEKPQAGRSPGLRLGERPATNEGSRNQIGCLGERPSKKLILRFFIFIFFPF